jgi:hypothetical protein
VCAILQKYKTNNKGLKSEMFNLMLITNDADLAVHAFKSGVSRIFIDLEINGKFERQGHLDTLISRHSISDVSLIRKTVPECELLVRINPYYGGSEQEIERVINSGADLIMLPMFNSVDEIKEVSKIIDGRAQFIPLIETVAATECLKEVVKTQGVNEVYIGLNDLHRDFGLKFMFEPLSNGLLESLVYVINKSGLPFGFGGLARIGEGTLPAELILAEHVRLGSSCSILSRTFHRKSETLSEFKNQMNLKDEVSKLLEKRKQHMTRTLKQEKVDQQKVEEIVTQIISRV